MIGFGTYRLKGDVAYTSVLNALKNGYNHIDTANLYGNEDQVGKAIKDSGIKRESIFVTTKIMVKDIQLGKDGIMKSISNSLDKIGTDYLDLVLFHAPEDDDSKLIQSWTILENIYLNKFSELRNKVRHIGVSNYNIRQLEIIIKNCQIKPYVNQIEITPYLNRVDLANYCKDNGIIVVAHTSLVKGEKFKDNKLIELSGKTNISPALLLLAWGLHRQYVVLPRTSKINNIIENIKAIDIKLSNDVLNCLDEFNEGYSTHPKYIKMS